MNKVRSEPKPKRWNRLREVRIQKLITQKELAEKSGVTYTTISLLENQLQGAWPLTKKRLARALKVTVEEIFPDG